MGQRRPEANHEAAVCSEASLQTEQSKACKHERFIITAFQWSPVARSANLSADSELFLDINIVRRQKLPKLEETESVLSARAFRKRFR